MIVLVRPLITEKSLHQATLGQYTFEVDRRANALQVAEAVRNRYDVTVLGVHVINVAGVEKRTKRGVGRTRHWKKALVTLKKGQKITGFEIAPDEPKDDKAPTGTANKS